MMMELTTTNQYTNEKYFILVQLIALNRLVPSSLLTITQFGPLKLEDKHSVRKLQL